MNRTAKCSAHRVPMVMVICFLAAGCGTDEAGIRTEQPLIEVPGSVRVGNAQSWQGVEAYQKFWGTDAEKPAADPAQLPPVAASEEEEAIRIKMAQTRVDIWEYGQEAYVNSYTETNRSGMITHEVTAVVNGRSIPTVKVRSRYRPLCQVQVRQLSF